MSSHGCPEIQLGPTIRLLIFMFYQLLQQMLEGDSSDDYKPALLDLLRLSEKLDLVPWMSTCCHHRHFMPTPSLPYGMEMNHRAPILGYLNGKRTIQGAATQNQVLGHRIPEISTQALVSQ